jgi:hypothetical protein
MVDILESAGQGAGLRELVDAVTAGGLKQRLFDHIDNESPRRRVRALLSSLHDPTLDEDLRILEQGFWSGVGETLSRGWDIATSEFSFSRMLMGLLHPILHPIDTISGLIDQLEGIYQSPSLYRIVTFGRDVYGLIGMVLGILGLILAGITALAVAGVITIPAAVPLGAITLAVNLLALAFFVGFIALSILRFVIDVVQGGQATTRTERRRTERRTGEDIQGFFGLAIFIVIALLLKAVIRAIRAPAVEEGAATPEQLQQTAADVQTQQGEATAQANEAQAQAQAGADAAGVDAPADTPPTATAESPPATTEPPAVTEPPPPTEPPATTGPAATGEPTVLEPPAEVPVEPPTATEPPTVPTEPPAPETVPDEPAAEPATEPPTEDPAQPAAPQLTLAQRIAQWIQDFRTRPAQGRGANRAYQIRECGPTEVEVRDGGARIFADGLIPEEGFLRDAKFIENTRRSPYIPDSECPDFIRDNVTDALRDEMDRYSRVIADPATPAVGLEIVTNNAAAAAFFEALMQEFGIPGRVVLKP